MAKVQHIKSARKEHKCNRCGHVIEKGESYYKGEINFGPTIVRCTKCGLEGWEVTTSDYQLRVGEILYRWREGYSADEEGLEAIKSELEDLKSELEDRLDNMPEGLQEGEAGCLLQERIEALDDALDNIDSIDFDEIKNSAAKDYLSEHEDDEELYEVDIDDLDGEEYEWVESNLGSDAQDGVHELIDEAFDDALTEALGDLGV